MTSNVSFPDLGPRTEGEEDKEARLVEGLAGLPDQLFFQEAHRMPRKFNGSGMASEDMRPGARVWLRLVLWSDSEVKAQSSHQWTPQGTSQKHPANRCCCVRTDVIPAFGKHFLLRLFSSLRVYFNYNIYENS